MTSAHESGRMALRCGVLSIVDCRTASELVAQG